MSYLQILKKNWIIVRWIVAAFPLGFTVGYQKEETFLKQERPLIKTASILSVKRQSVPIFWNAGVEKRLLF